MKQVNKRGSTIQIGSIILLAVTALLIFDVRSVMAAGSVSGKIVVNAIVLPGATIRVLQQPTVVVVTDKDVKRGYVDAEFPVFAEVSNNSRRGCLIEMALADLPVREVVVGIMGKSVSLMPVGGIIPVQVTGRHRVSVTFRFVLAQEARPEIYAWPIHLSATPVL